LRSIPLRASGRLYGKISTGTADTAAPTAPTSLTPSGTTQTTTNLSWTASTDNVGNCIRCVSRRYFKTSVTGTSYSVSGLTASTAYSFTVKAKDAAGNVSASSNTANVTTTASAGVELPTYCSLNTLKVLPITKH
jgi:chitodextrinase